MEGSGQFEISEAGAVAASGRIRMAGENEKIIDMEPPCPNAADIASCDLDAEDVYKELRLRGCEYYDQFQGILKANIKRPNGMLKWDNNWITFIDTMIHGSSLAYPKRALKLPVKIISCRIDPVVHMEMTKKATESGVGYVYDKRMRTCRSGGIILQGLKCNTAPQRVTEDVMVLNEHAFVPHIDSESTRQRRQAYLQEYIDACSGAAQCILQNYCGEESESLEAGKCIYNASGEVTEYNLKNKAENQGLLKTLTSIQEEMNRSDLSLVQIIQSAMETYEKELENDVIRTALFEEDPLRHLLDVVVENTSATKLEVFPNKKLPEADLLVACLTTWGSSQLEILAQQLSVQSKKQGFILIALRTAVTPAEQVLMSMGCIQLQVHKEDDVESFFNSYGFTVIGLKSNNFTTLLLLRKTKGILEEAKPEVLDVSSDNFHWIEELRQKRSNTRTCQTDTLFGCSLMTTIQAASSAWQTASDGRQEEGILGGDAVAAQDGGQSNREDAQHGDDSTMPYRQGELRQNPELAPGLKGTQTSQQKEVNEYQNQWWDKKIDDEQELNQHSLNSSRQPHAASPKGDRTEETNMAPDEVRNRVQRKKKKQWDVEVSLSSSDESSALVIDEAALQSLGRKNSEDTSKGRTRSGPSWTTNKDGR
ncbi:hypothetical protein HPB49_026567 [Dermacentor silvarum]|nr:hypothetical protein HPB49_026567 [Dermacentor silvarum]